GGRGHALQEQPRARAGTAHEHDVARAREAPRGQHQQPIPLPERRLHAVAADGDPPWSAYFFVAQNMSLISFTAPCRSAAACASTFCLFFEASFNAFQNESWSFGNFSRCSGLK